MGSLGNRIVGIYFDFFGTLIDALYAQQWIWTQIFKRLGKEIHPTDPRILIGMHHQWKECDRLLEEEGIIYPQFTQEDRTRLNQIMLDQFAVKHENAANIITEEFQTNFFQGYRLNNGCKATLEQIKAQNIKIGLFTNGDQVKVQTKLKELGIFHLFDIFIHSGDYGYHKNDNEMFQIAIQAMNPENPKQLIHVGDDLEMDIKMAKKTGMIPILFDVLQECSFPGVRIIHTFPEILDVLSVYRSFK